MRNGMVFAGIAFAITLAILVGSRLSNEAIAMVVGVMCGISASIPVSIALVIAASRRWGQGENVRESDAARTYPAQPPVVVITPPQQNQVPNPYSGAPYYLPPGAPAPGAPREFKIVGDDE